MVFTLIRVDLCTEEHLAKMVILWIVLLMGINTILCYGKVIENSSSITCFIKKIPYNLSIPKNVVMYPIYCNSENQWCSSGLFEHLDSIAMIEYEAELFFMKFKNNSDFYFYHKFIDSFQQSVELFRVFVDVIGKADNENNSFVLKQEVCLLFDFDELQNDLRHLSQYVSDLTRIGDWILYYYPICFSVELTVGLLGNSMVILILIRNPQLRSETNKLVLNLAIGDILLLAFNVGGYYIAMRWWFLRISRTACLLVMFTSKFTTGISIYSMAALSLLRLLAVTAVPGNRACAFLQRYVKGGILVIVVWILSACITVPNILDVTSTCTLEESAMQHYLNFIFFCILPLIIIAVFSFITSRLLKKSAQDMPGENIPNIQQEKKIRKRGARVILALTVLFAVTFVPFYTYFLIDGKINPKYVNLLEYNIIARVLYPLNSCLNPIALCVASGSFRKEFKTYLLCCKRKGKQTSEAHSAKRVYALTVV